MTEERYYVSRHEDGSWQVFDTEDGAKTRWSATYWGARWEADHLNGKHESKPHAKCDLCKET